MRRLLDFRRIVPDIHVMLQEEVAERLAAGPGSKTYGILSVLYGLWADLDIPALQAGLLLPPPSVQSAILRVRFLPAPRHESAISPPLKPWSHVPSVNDEKRLKIICKIAMLTQATLEVAQHRGTRRAETLSVVEFARLSESLWEGRRANG